MLGRLLPPNGDTERLADVELLEDELLLDWRVLSGKFDAGDELAGRDMPAPPGRCGRLYDEPPDGRDGLLDDDGPGEPVVVGRGPKRNPLPDEPSDDSSSSSSSSSSPK